MNFNKGKLLTAAEARRLSDEATQRVTSYIDLERSVISQIDSSATAGRLRTHYLFNKSELPAIPAIVSHLEVLGFQTDLLETILTISWGV